MRKSKFLIITIFTSVLLIAGCGNNDNNNKRSVESRDEPHFSSEIEDRGGSLQFGAGYGFSDFDLEIDIDGKDAIDIDYKIDTQNDTFKVEYKNNIQDFHLKDEEAMNAVHDFFMEAQISNEKPKDKIIREILESLNIEGYSKFDLEVNFNDDTSLSIHETN